MKTRMIFTAAFMMCVAVLVGQTRVVAHRGYWKTEGSAQNSITALMKADQVRAWGSELDILQTADGVLVVNHDATVGPDKILIEAANYADIKDIKLPNGETLPTLKDYMKAFKKECRHTLLILEIKQHTTDEKMIAATRAVVDMVKNMKIKDRVEYISFMPVICDEVLKCDPKAKVAYLSNKLTPAQCKERGYTGVDFHYSQFQLRPHWVKECHDLGLEVNCWTVNGDEALRQMIELGVDIITTDVPERAAQLIKEYEGKK
ncbi:MAG: glycerophosphodiester phosphodiesterase [Flavobacteriales bacterium]|nr:glycerophosphodiester phosphodiesterase [Flavobacteriales bacterium]